MAASTENSQTTTTGSLQRTSSQTAEDYIASQLQLEADAREALPYQFNTCTQQLGPLRQTIFACLTCSPPPASRLQQHTPAGICYSCSISCHGEHTLVELFTKRDFVCDCGTTRLSNSGTPCALRHNAQTGMKGGVVGEEARQGNKYNQNFEGKFCGCGEEYDPEKEKGTMFQCLGLGTVEDGGCGEDWWHPECLMGLPEIKPEHRPKNEPTNGTLETVKEDGEERAATEETANEEEQVDEAPLPPGFPAEDDFDHLICYKCVNAFPWIKQYAGAPGFLPAVSAEGAVAANGSAGNEPTTSLAQESQSKKRKAEDEAEDSQDSKKAKADPEAGPETTDSAPHSNGHVDTVPPSNGEVTAPMHTTLPPPPTGSVTLFLKEDFRDGFCRCAECFPRLAKHRQLLEEEETYEPPVSESDAESNAPGSIAGRSVNSGSLLERGEAALSSMDRVRAIEGVMAYNHVKDKVKAFLQPFAESGQLVGAEDIKAYFAKLRGDEQAMREAAVGASGSGGESDHRREQGGY